jgi:hypothetical protein
LYLTGAKVEDNAVLYTTRRDYLKPADVFAILDKPEQSYLPLWFG